MSYLKFKNWLKYSRTTLLLIVTTNIFLQVEMLTEGTILSNQFSQNFRRHRDELVLMNNSFTILSDVKSVLSCASHCVSFTQCRGFTYSVNHQECQIKDTLTNCSSAGDLKSLKSDVVYYHHVDKTCKTNGSYCF